MTDKTLPKIAICSAHEKPHYWDALKDVKHPLNQVWPRFMDHDPSFKCYFKKILEYEWLRKFQLAVIEQGLDGEEIIVASGNSIPFFWPEINGVGNADDLQACPQILNSLPDGGWDTIVARGIRQHHSRHGLPLVDLPVLTRDQDSDMATCHLENKPNALSALFITVLPHRRNMGLAERLIEAMKQTARAETL